MSYHVSFRVKVEGIDKYIPVGDCDANITYNVNNIIRKSTGLPWDNGINNGYCKDVIPKIKIGYDELCRNPEKYKEYEAENGWGTVDGTKRFFRKIIAAWDELRYYEDYDLAEVATFWIT